jgi:hypothetical protein
MTTKSWAPNANEKPVTGLESIEMKATVKASIPKGLKQLCLGEHGESMCFVKAVHPFSLLATSQCMLHTQMLPSRLAVAARAKCKFGDVYVSMVT